MASVEEAQEVLAALGMPDEQRNQMAALTLLALCGLAPKLAWSQAEPEARTLTKGIMEYVHEYYDVSYAPNTRENFRRDVLHQFVQGGIAELNPHNPERPTNSPHTDYALTTEAYEAIRRFGLSGWEAAASRFRGESELLAAKYRRKREQHKVPVQLPDGYSLDLSPGTHNEIQRAVVEEFGPRFAPGSKLLYLGDTAKKELILDQPELERLQFPVGDRGKLPDVVLHDLVRDWLFLVEAVASRNPMSPTRVEALGMMLEKCDSKPVYVSAFLDAAEFQKHAGSIAWETVVWLADQPDHLIHYDGDKLLTPRERK